MKRHVYLILVVAWSVASAATAGEDLPTLEQVLDRYIEAMGGRDTIEKLESRVIVGREIDDRPYKGPPVESNLKIWGDTSGDWTMESDLDGKIKLQGSSEGSKWVKQHGMETQPGKHKDTKLAFLFNPQGPLMVAKYFPNPRLTGTWDYDGVAYYKVENDLKFEYYTLYFEVETGMLTRIGYHWKLEGFREVDGVLVPGVVFQGRKGGSTNLYFDEVTHGDEVAGHLQPGGK
jgi:hypothetical protein